MLESLTTSDLFVPGIILGGAGLIFLTLMLFAVAQWMKVAAARRWPVALGTVLESRVVEEYYDGTSFIPRITYQYQVGGQIYTNDLIAFGSRNVQVGGTWGERKAHATAARYPAGSSVEVHYHPQQPAKSVLEIRSTAAVVLVIAGAFTLLMGLFFAVTVLIVNTSSR
jgi:hypothetical protein